MEGGEERMVKVMKLALVCLAAVVLAGVAMPVFAQEKAQTVPANLVLGEVVSVDLVKSEVVVKQLKDAIAGTYENTACAVAPETKITKGDVVLKLSDLIAGDKIIVKSTADASGNQKVESISVENKEAAPVK